MTRLRRRRRGSPSAVPAGGLREFVYLDDPSVYSLLASRRGAVETDFTDTETASVTAELNAGLTLGPSDSGGTAGWRRQSGRSTTAQVVRKSSAQARFKQLLDSETDRLLLHAQPRRPAPLLDLAAELDDLTATPNDWVVDASRLKRGDLLELEVALEADPAFKLAETMNAFTRLVGEDTAALGLGNVDGIEEATALTRLLDQLLGDLIPIRARAVNYDQVSDGGRTYLVHRDVLARLTEPPSAREPVWVCGFCDAGLFSKDPRRVLFGANPYTAMCRVSADRLQDDWTPVLLADVLATIDPAIGQQLTDMTRGLLPAIRSAADPAAVGVETVRASDVLRHYAADLAAFCEIAVSAQDLAGALPDEEMAWPLGLGERRALFAQVTALVFELADQPVDRVVAAQLRQVAVDEAQPRLLAPDAPMADDAVLDDGGVLAVEFIGIYW